VRGWGIISSLFGLYSQILSADDISTRTLFSFSLLFNPSSRSVVNAVPSVCPPCNSLHSCRANRLCFSPVLCLVSSQLHGSPRITFLLQISPWFQTVFLFFFSHSFLVFLYEYISCLPFFKHARPFNIYHPLPGFHDLCIPLKGDFRPAAATASSLRIPQLRSLDGAHAVGRLCTFS